MSQPQQQITASSNRSSSANQSVSESSRIFGRAICRLLSDRSYEKRKQAGTEIEERVRELNQRTHDSESCRTGINHMIDALSNDFLSSPNPNNRKGGLIGLASIAIGLESFNATPHIDSLITLTLQEFVDPEPRVRYYACEAMYNVFKAAGKAPYQSGVLKRFLELFDGVCLLCADVDVDVRHGSQHLDHFLKDIILETSGNRNTILRQDSSFVSSSVNVPNLVEAIRDRLLLPSPYIKQLMLSWVSILPTAPDVDLLVLLTNLLRELLMLLNDSSSNIRQTADAILSSSLTDIKARDFKRNDVPHITRLVQILCSVHRSSQAKPTVLAASVWLHEILLLATTRSPTVLNVSETPSSATNASSSAVLSALDPLIVDLLEAVLSCLAYFPSTSEISRIAFQSHSFLTTIILSNSIADRAPTLLRVILDIFSTKEKAVGNSFTLETRLTQDPCGLHCGTANIGGIGKSNDQGEAGDEKIQRMNDSRVLTARAPHQASTPDLGQPGMPNRSTSAGSFFHHPSNADMDETGDERLRSIGLYWMAVLVALSKDTTQLPTKEPLSIAIAHSRHVKESVSSGALRLIAALCHRLPNLYQQVTEELLSQFSLTRGSRQLVLDETNRKVIRELSVLLGAKRFYLEFSRALLRFTGQSAADSVSIATADSPVSPRSRCSHDTATCSNTKYIGPSVQTSRGVACIPSPRIFSNDDQLSQSSDNSAVEGGQHVSEKGNDNKSPSVQGNGTVISLEIASELVQMMNWVLFTSVEISTVRDELKNGKTRYSSQALEKLEYAVAHMGTRFAVLPDATISMVSMDGSTTQWRRLHCVYIATFEPSVSIFVQFNQLLQLLDSPIFSALRLKLTRPSEHPVLVESLLALAHLLPSSTGLESLIKRLDLAKIAILLQPFYPGNAVPVTSRHNLDKDLIFAMLSDIVRQHKSVIPTVAPENEHAVTSRTVSELMALVSGNQSDARLIQTPPQPDTSKRPHSSKSSIRENLAAIGDGNNKREVGKSLSAAASEHQARTQESEEPFTRSRLSCGQNASSIVPGNVDTTQRQKKNAALRSGSQDRAELSPQHRPVDREELTELSAAEAIPVGCVESLPQLETLKRAGHAYRPDVLSPQQRSRDISPERDAAHSVILFGESRHGGSQDQIEETEQQGVLPSPTSDDQQNSNPHTFWPNIWKSNNT